MKSFGSESIATGWRFDHYNNYARDLIRLIGPYAMFSFSSTASELCWFSSKLSYNGPRGLFSNSQSALISGSLLLDLSVV